MLNLQSGKDEVKYPQAIIDEQSCVLAKLYALLRWQDEAVPDVNIDDERGVDEDLDGQSVLAPLTMLVIAALLTIPSRV